jgi:hypothetical protein
MVLLDQLANWRGSNSAAICIHDLPDSQNIRENAAAEGEADAPGSVGNGHMGAVSDLIASGIAVWRTATME